MRLVLRTSKFRRLTSSCRTDTILKIVMRLGCFWRHTLSSNVAMPLEHIVEPADRREIQDGDQGITVLEHLPEQIKGKCTFQCFRPCFLQSSWSGSSLQCSIPGPSTQSSRTGTKRRGMCSSAPSFATGRYTIKRACAILPRLYDDISSF